MAATTTHLAGAALGATPEGVGLRGLLFERIMERVHRYFVKLVWDPDGVDECLQRTLVRLEESLRDGSYDPRRSFNRWMWIKAHSVWVDWCRERSRAPGAIPDGAVDPGTPSEEGAIDAAMDARALLDHLRGTLDPEVLEVFILARGEGKSLVEVAATVGRDRKTARKLLDGADREAVRFIEGRSPRR